MPKELYPHPRDSRQVSFKVSIAEYEELKAVASHLKCPPTTAARRLIIAGLRNIMNTEEEDEAFKATRYFNSAGLEAWLLAKGKSTTQFSYDMGLNAKRIFGYGGNDYMPSKEVRGKLLRYTNLPLNILFPPR